MKPDPDDRDDVESLAPDKDRGDVLDSLEDGDSAARASAQFDTRFSIIVAALMVLIIAALAGLWLIERNRRVRAERELAEFAHKQLQAQAMLSQFALGGLQGVSQPAQPVNRRDLPSDQVTLEHKERTMFKISADAGERLGFLPGDIVFVADRPTTQPAASRPALEKPGAATAPAKPAPTPAKAVPPTDLP